MALDDLNLEFEDEEEVKRKKSDAMNVDVDLEFHNPISGGGDKTRGAPVAAKPELKAQSMPVKPAVGGPNINRQVSNVKSINDARPQQLGAVKRPSTMGATAQASSVQSSSSPAAAPRVMGSNALQSEESFFLESQELVEAREQLKKVEFESAVKVSVAEFKTEMLSELNGDMKLLEHQINQLLVRINAKHPDMKNEVLTIKKLVNDFTAKKRK